MSRLPSVTARQVVAALKKAGFVELRQVGAHLTLHNYSTKLTTVVPMHSGDVKRPLVKAIIKQAGLTPEQFAELI